MATTIDDIESYFIRMGVQPDEVEEGTWIIRNPDGAPVVVRAESPLVLLRLKVMDLPADAGDTRLAPLYRRMLELNATDIVHGSYGIETDEVVLSHALDLDTLDFSELRNAYESLVLAAASHVADLAQLVPVAHEG